MKIGFKYKKEILFYIILLVVGIAVIASKKNYNVDEVYTYGLANNIEDEISLSPKKAFMYEPAESVYKEYMTVQEGKRFNFVNVWDKQTADVHPPFYYVFVHIISSIFVGSCSKWIAGAVNIAFMLLSLWMVRKIIYIFDCTEQEKDLISTFFVFSVGMMNATSFLRMYVMTMFMVTLCAWWLLNFVDQKRTIKFYVGMTVIAVCGTLTHYYFLLYLFFISFFFGLYLLANKRILDAVKYIVSMFVAGGVSYLIFPAMPRHIFLGGRGEQSFDNFRGGIDSYWNQLKAFWKFIDNDLFGGYLLAIVCICCFLLIASSVKEKRVSAPTNKKWMWLLLGGPCICYFLLVAKIAVYITERYMYPIYAVAMVFVVLAVKSFFDSILHDYLKGRVFLWAMVLGIMTFGCYKNCTWPTLYRSTDALLKKSASYQDVSCLYVYKRVNSWKLQPSYMEVKNYKSVVFFEDNIDELIEMYDLCKEEDFVLYVVDCNAESIISQIMEYCPQINAYEKLGSYGYATSYYLYGKDLISDTGYLRSFDKTFYLGCDEESGNICVSETGELLRAIKAKDMDYYNLYVQNGLLDLYHGVLTEGQNI